MIHSHRIVGFVTALTLATALHGAPETHTRNRSAPTTAAAAGTPERWTDAQGNFHRRAHTGHVTNYDETKVGRYTLPDSLVLKSGIPVKDRDTWETQRRPEILELYRAEIYGRVPEGAPAVHFDVLSTTPALGGKALHRHIAARFSGATGAEVRVNLHLYFPAQAARPSPVVLQLLFGQAPDFDRLASIDNPPTKPAETAPLAALLARGFAYAVFRYTEVEPDGSNAPTIGVRALARGESEGADAPAAWGAISAWAWGASRMLDYLQTDPAIDARRVALVGHSRLGKTVLWAGAQDTRFKMIFSSCAGEMGSSLARRDYGETVDDIASNFAGQFAPNFGKYLGGWNDLPVDAHMLIALSAPRPVLITGGTQDQWADPRGEFLAEVAAGPVYRLMGKRELPTNQFPPADTPLTTGDLAYFYHTGGHAITPEDWSVFLDFADRYLRR